MGLLMCVMVVVLMELFLISNGEVHKVGDTQGWTIMGTPNYTGWSISKTFHLGDTILFEYNNKFHNVMEVTKADFRACDASSPLATYTTGNDSITIKRRGHFFFMCGVPGHCQIGQKVNIRIPKLKSRATAPLPSPPVALVPTPSPTDSDGSDSSNTIGPVTNTSSGDTLCVGWLVVVLAAVVAAFAASFI